MSILVAPDSFKGRALASAFSSSGQPRPQP